MKRDDGRTILKALDTMAAGRLQDPDVRQSVVHARDALDRQEAVIRGLRRAVTVFAAVRNDSHDCVDPLNEQLQDKAEAIRKSGKRGDYRKRPF